MIDNHPMTLADFHKIKNLDFGAVVESAEAALMEREKFLEALDIIANKPIGHSEASCREVLEGVVAIARAALSKLDPLPPNPGRNPTKESPDGLAAGGE